MASLTLADEFRDTAVGYIIRKVSKGKFLAFPEERPDFVLPEVYSHFCNEQGQQPQEESWPKRSEETQVPSLHSLSRPVTASTQVDDSHLQSVSHSNLDLTKPPDVYIPLRDLHLPPDLNSLRPPTGLDTLRPSIDIDPRYRPSTDIERALTLPAIDRQLSQAHQNLVTPDGAILVDWYGPDDPANPQNWRMGRKAFFAFMICIYTTSVYLGSAIYTSSERAVSEAFNVSSTKASLGLALYVFGCE